MTDGLWQTAYDRRPMTDGLWQTAYDRRPVTDGRWQTSDDRQPLTVMQSAEGLLGRGVGCRSFRAVGGWAEHRPVALCGPQKWYARDVRSAVPRARQTTAVSPGHSRRNVWDCLLIGHAGFGWVRCRLMPELCYFWNKYNSVVFVIATKLNDNTYLLNL